MVNNSLVSVILPTYNRSEYLGRAIESVLNQNYNNFELIIIDDSSTDKTSEVILKYKDSRIRVVKNQENIGFVKSLNKGIKQANGKYIARLDDDDFWTSPDKLEKQVAFLENNPDYVLVSCGMIREDDNGVREVLTLEHDNEIRDMMLFASPIVHIGAVFSKKAFDLVGGYDEDLYFSQDSDLWAKLGKVGKMYNIHEYFTHAFIAGHNRSSKKMSYHLWLKQKIRFRHRKDYPHFYKAFAIGFLAYLFSMIPFRKKLDFLYQRLRKFILGKRYI